MKYIHACNRVAVAVFTWLAVVDFAYARAIPIAGSIPPGLTAQWIADACGSGSGSVVADSSTATKVEVFEPMKGADIDFSAMRQKSIPKSATVYPVKIAYKMLISSSFNKNKKYMVGSRKGFVYKSPFGKFECLAGQDM
jgi:hypothetical protein